MKLFNFCFSIFLGFLEIELNKDELPFQEPEENPPAPQPREMMDLEVTCFSFSYFELIYSLKFIDKTIIDKLDYELKEINTNADVLMKNFNELTELKYNLIMTQDFFQNVNNYY